MITPPMSLSEYITNYKNQGMLMSHYFLEEWLTDDDEKDFFKVYEENLLAKHSAFLNESKVTIKLTDEEYRKYRCNAHALSDKLYGTTELWFLILHANEMFSESEFINARCKVYKPAVLDQLKEIMIVEDDAYRKNRASIFKQQALLKKRFGT